MGWATTATPQLTSKSSRRIFAGRLKIGGWFQVVGCFQVILKMDGVPIRTSTTAMLVPLTPSTKTRAQISTYIPTEPMGQPGIVTTMEVKALIACQFKLGLMPLQWQRRPPPDTVTPCSHGQQVPWGSVFSLRWHT